MPWSTGAARVEYANYNVIMHGEKYGELTSWNAEEAHREDTMGYPRACLVIEAQSVILEFLASMVKAIVGYSPKESGSSSTWTSQVVARFDGNTHGSTSSHHAYNLPRKFDIEFLLDLSKARLSSAQDHLWLLQTDAGYVRNTVRTLKGTKWVIVAVETCIDCLVQRSVRCPAIGLSNGR
jgi:hypothetical protein